MANDDPFTGRKIDGVLGKLITGFYIGPLGQNVLRPFLLRPAESMAKWRQQNFVNRKTPLQQGHTIGTNQKEAPKRQAGKHYTVTG